MNKKKTVLLLLLILLTPLLFGESLRVAAVQLEIHKSTYSSDARFRAEMETRVSEAVRMFHADLIIFPEYTSVFPAITPYYGYLEEGKTYEDILSAIGVSTLRELFIEEAPRMNAVLSIWGDLAKKYDVTIVGGSYFAYHDGKLTNRLIIFGPDGNLIYYQDKYFLTDFETDIAGLSPGSPETPEGIRIKGKKIVFTLCRDTFLNRWEKMYDDADLWIDIKANGETYGEEQVALFAKALPARLALSHARYGVTVCLTGDFLDLFWEGESSFIGRTDEGVHTFIKARTPKKEDIFYFVVD